MSVPLRLEVECVETIQQPVRRKARRRAVSPARKLAGITVIVSVLSVVGLACVGAGTVIHDISAPAGLRMVAGGSTSALSSVVGSVARSNGFVTVTGAVANTGGRTASQVAAVVELLDKQDHTVQVDSSMVAFNNVGTGASVPFHVIIPDESSAVGYRISFRHPDGREID